MGQQQGSAWEPEVGMMSALDPLKRTTEENVPQDPKAYYISRLFLAGPLTI